MGKVIYTLLSKNLQLNTDLLGKVPAFPTNMYNFTNANLNSINIDETYNYNYVVALSTDGFGTKPASGWQNIVNFYSNHFVTQLAFSCSNKATRERAVYMWIRERYAGIDYIWSDWVQVI